jgi:3-oxoacyl-[acyl-carrier protein] reductase
MLNGKTAIITGGTAGIGKAIALAFAKNGARVAIFGQNEERGAEVVAQLGEGALFVKTDVSSLAETEHSIQEVLKAFGTIDILVNNAGITRDGLLLKMTEEDWDKVIDTNLKSCFNTCKVLVRQFLKAKKGRIINVSSVVGITGNAGQANYAASKAGIIGLTKAVAQEIASRGINVNCIAPGYINTPMTDALNQDQKDQILSKIPFARMGTPEEVANVALFLASDLAAYVTGQVITVDGGMVM